MAALAYVQRVASFASSWLELPLLERDPGPQPFVSILVPARDEERSVERCIRSLLAQEWLDFEVIAIDDRSEDTTPAILARLAAEYPRLRVVAGKALPPGWVGKPWALYQGAQRASGEWLLFTDADSTHASGGVASALYFARRAEVAALSIATQQDLGSFWEGAVLPSILGLVLLACGTLGEINDPARPRNALANGQYLLVRRDAYDALGGHATLHGEIAEDLAFARNLKADGRFRLLLAAGEQLASVRMYRSFGEIWRGFSKNAFAGTQGNVVALLLGTAFLLSISAAPPLLAARALQKRRWPEALEALACSAAAMAAAGWSFERTRLPRRLGIFQPLGTALFAAIALDSARLTLSGRGVSWRGRIYGADRKREALGPDPKGAR